MIRVLVADDHTIVRQGLRRVLAILVLSMHAEAQLVGSAITAGATGYLTKDSEPEMILAAIRNCARGQHYIHPELGARLLFGELVRYALRNHMIEP